MKHKQPVLKDLNSILHIPIWLVSAVEMAEVNKRNITKSNLTSKNLQCKTLHEYLKGLPPDVIDKLYSHSMACLAVCRELSEIAKQYVMRLLFLEQPVPQAVIASWLSKAHASEHKEATDALMELKIFKESSVSGGLPAWTLNSNFKKNMRIALFGGGKDLFMAPPQEPDSKPRDTEFLKSYAMERWNCILNYMAGSRQHEGISADAVKILLSAGLLSKDGGTINITQEGFQFLLMDTSSQVWYFILQYLDTLESRGLDLALCLMLLLHLRCSTLGNDYSTEEMNEGLQIFLQHLREFGLVYQRKRKSGRFYPTHLVLGMAISQNSLLDQPVEEGYIVVETNYRIYVYTTSNLKVAIVGLFCHFLYRLPGVVVGVLTRESIRAALRMGINAQRIVHFLKVHAHPTMINSGSPVLPPTIVDQIFLWEQERNRFTFTDGILYSQFISQADFDVLRNYAQDTGALVWQNEKKRTLVISKSSQDDVKKFWKRYSKNST